MGAAGIGAGAGRVGTGAGSTGLGGVAAGGVAAGGVVAAFGRVWSGVTGAVGAGVARAGDGSAAFGDAAWIGGVGGDDSAAGGAWSVIASAESHPHPGGGQEPQDLRRHPASKRQADALSIVSRQITSATRT